MPNASDQGFLIVLVGPSGVGKSTIARRLAGQLDVAYIVSATTRPRKPGDQTGKTYDHITAEEFFRRMDADEFLEYAHVHGNYYGTPKHPCLDLLAQGKDILLEIDVQGALQIRCQYPEALLVFILPPNGDTLWQRLTDRGRDKPDEIEKRFREARREIQMARGSRAFDFMVINDNLDHAVAQIESIIRLERTGGL